MNKDKRSENTLLFLSGRNPAEMVILSISCCRSSQVADSKDYDHNIAAVQFNLKASENLKTRLKTSHKV